MRFEWDGEKKQANIRKHGIDFVDVPLVFNGPMLSALDERKEYGEDRWIGVGYLRNMVVVVAFTEPRPDTIRIISARQASRYERNRFEQTLRD